MNRSLRLALSITVIGLAAALAVAAYFQFPRAGLLLPMTVLFTGIVIVMRWPRGRDRDCDPAFEAMFAEWEAIKDFVMGPEAADDVTVDPEASERWLARMARMREFLEKHNEVLVRRGLLAEMEAPLKAEQELRAAIVAEAEAADRVLDVCAAEAEAETKLNVARLGVLEALENLPPDAWDEMEPTERSRMMDELLELRRNLDALLDSLPIDLRREWEAKLGVD